MKIVLIGFATGGKTTVGKMLAKQLNIDFYDVDQLVENFQQISVREYINERGLESFRIHENLAMASICNRTECVVSCGGGSVTQPNFSCLKQNAKVVWLKVSAQTVSSRLDGVTRPLFDDLSLEQLGKKVDERNELYSQHYDICVQVDDKTPEQIVTEILTKLNID